MSLGYGIIGAGMMGQEHIRNIALIAGARVTADRSRRTDHDPDLDPGMRG